jgi:hypothetical protein
MYLDIHLNVVCNGSYGSSLYVWPVAAPHNDYIDENLPDEDEPDATARVPAPRIPSNKSPVANISHALPQTRKSMASWDICNMMCLAGASGLEQEIADADAAMPLEGLPVQASGQVVRADALGSNERPGNY